MRFSEFGISEARRPVAIQPSAVQQQSRINNIVANYAASEQQQQKPSEIEVAIAMQRYAALKKQRNRSYAQQLQQQLATAARYS